MSGLVGPELRVETIDGDFSVPPGDIFTFGRSRSCTFCVDDSDLNISRWAGRIWFEGDGWVLENTSEQRSLVVLDRDRRTRRDLLGGQRHLLDGAQFEIALAGSRRSHFRFTVHNEGGTRAVNESGSDGVVVNGESATLGPPQLSERQRLDVAALAWEWHDPPAWREPRPLTYERAARKLGCTAKSLERRVSELKAALLRRGYQQLSDLPMLCSFLVTACRAVGPEDFARAGAMGDAEAPRP